MAEVRGSLEATILLNKNTCYFMRTGRCSLNLVDDVSMMPAVKSGPAELLYCPRLYQIMRDKRRSRSVKVIPCECGHAEIVAGAQRACIASQKRLQVRVSFEGDTCYDLCPVCGRQMTFDEASAMNQGGARIITLRAVIESEPSDKDE